MGDALLLLQDLEARGNTVAVVEGKLRVHLNPPLNGVLRERLSALRNQLIALLSNHREAEPEQDQERLRSEAVRLAPYLFRGVVFEGGSGTLVGIFRDRVTVHTGQVILSLNPEDVRPADGE